MIFDGDVEIIGNTTSNIYISNNPATTSNEVVILSQLDDINSQLQKEIDQTNANLNNTSSQLQGEIDNIDGLFSYNPEPDKVPQANSNGNINLGWLNLPPNGLLYYTSSDIYMGTSGGFATYEFDFTNWQQDYLSKVPKANLIADPFYVVPIIQNQYMTVGNAPAMIGSYSIHLFASTKPTYLNGNFYQMQITLGQSDAELAGQSGYYTNGGPGSFTYSSWQQPPALHAYSTLGLVAYTIHFLGGPQNVLWNTMPYNNNGNLQITVSYSPQGFVIASYEFSCYNTNPNVTYTVNNIYMNGNPVTEYVNNSSAEYVVSGAGSEISGGQELVLPLTLPPFSMAGGLFKNIATPIEFAVSGSDGSNQTISVTNINTFNINNMLTIPTNG